MNPDASLLSPDRLFGPANALAMLGWLLLAASPLLGARAALARRIAGRWLPLVFAVLYGVLIVSSWGPGGFGSLQQVRELFAVPGLLLAGWLHYLAFDLFVGAWIAERWAARGLRPVVELLVRLPLLALTFLFGPLGLLAHALVQLLWPARPAPTTA